MRFPQTAILALTAAVHAANTTYLMKKPESSVMVHYDSKLAPDSTYLDHKAHSSKYSFTHPGPTLVQRLAPIEIVGNKFFNSKTGKQFFLKGIAYQPSRSTNDVVAFLYDGITIIDPMADPRLCKRDLPYLTDLGVNTVRVYSIDTDKDHDECFELFRDAGIYVIADLSEPNRSVNRDSPNWDTNLLIRYKTVVDILHKYDNVLGFFAGNEVTNDKTNTNASPYVKSSIRDVKLYIKEKNYREIPVGYSTNDDAETREDLATYFACGEVSADFYGINMYEWCGYSSYHTSGYKERTEDFRDYPMPVFFSEFGCNVERPRPFTEVDALFGRMMTDVWSGGLAYMYFEEPNHYGVVKVTPSGQVAPLPDYYNLRRAYSEVSPKGVTLEEYKKTLKSLSYPKCPEKSSIWKASTQLPKLPDQLKCVCMESALKCKVSSGVKKNDLSKIFEFACNKIDCTEIRSDGSEGVYGSFSDCSDYQKASYVLNEVFKREGTKDDDCNFGGIAQLAYITATETELQTRVTGNGTTCAIALGDELMERLLLETVIIEDPKVTYLRNTSNGSSGGNLLSSRAASTRQFYFNLSVNFGLAFVFVVIVTLIA